MRITKDAKKFIAKILVAVLIISMMPSFGIETKAETSQTSDGVLWLAYLDGKYDVTINKVGDIAYAEIVNSNGYCGIRYGTGPGAGLTEYYEFANLGALRKLYVSSDVTVDVDCLMGFDLIYVYSGGILNLNVNSIEVSELDNYGTLTISNNSEIDVLKNYNKVTVDTLTATPASVITGTSGTWAVTTSYTASSFNSELMGTVEANEDTFINTDGGTFTLKVGNATREISGSANGYAGELVHETLDPSGLTLTVSGVNLVDGMYFAKDKITISATTGYKFGNTDSYNTSKDYSVGDCTAPTPAPINGGFRFQNSEGETTQSLYVKDYITPANIITKIGDFYYYHIEFDNQNPEISEVEKKTGTTTESITFEEGMSIDADEVTFTIDDHYLYSVTVNDGRNYTRESTTYPVTSMGGDFWEAEITFKRTAGESKTYTMTATDCSGNEKTLSFTLKSEYLSSDGLKCTLSGLVNEKYTKDKVTVKAPDGYEIMPSYGSGDKYVESVDYKKSDLYGSDGKFKSDLTFTFKRKSDGAVTKPVAWDKCCDFLDDVIFDEIDPAISTVTADNKTITFKTGDVIEAASVTFTVTDVNLEKIVVDKTVTDRTNGVKKDGNLYKGTVTFTVAAGESKSYKFTAYDMSGRAVEYTFTLKYPRQVPALTVALADQFAGVTYAPTITTVSDGAKDVKYYYAESVKASVSDNTFSETVPTMPGKYVVKAVIPETNKYLAATAYAEFSIAYLPAPENPYTLEGETGDNDYYTSDVTITPPTGYTICASLTGTYTKTLTYSAALTNIYLKQTSTGALTGPIAFNETLKVDKTAPALSTAAKNQAGNVVDLSKLIYADKVTFTISDEHLSKVTINGEEVSFTDGKVTVSLICNGHKYFNIVAVDEAGNEYSFRVEMKATWLQSGIVPVGILISLVPGEGVALEPGEFIIEDSDDTTVYNGGMEVYVSEETELTLIKVN